MLNHLYVMKNRNPNPNEEDGDVEDDVMILGSTQRYRAKFVTYVFYKPSQEEDDGDDWDV